MDSSSSIIKIIFDIAYTSKGSLSQECGVSVELGYFFSASHKHSCSRKKIPGHFQSSGSAERAGTSLDSCPIKLLTYLDFSLSVYLHASCPSSDFPMYRI